MTLTKKMATGVLGFLLLVFIGTYLITMNNARNYFIEQLESNSQDTATSLGLSLSNALAIEDKAILLAMVQAVFDRGYFESIVVKDIHGKILVSRTLAPEETGVPQWFFQLVDWPRAKQSSLIMNGWNQVGEVLVMSNPNYVSKTLWDTALALVQWYAFFALTSIALVYAFIHWLLRPLNRLKNQAISIRAHHFPIEPKIPKTLELKEVTLAMNQMVLRMSELFDEQLKNIQELKQKIYQDPLTGLNNRQFFIQQLTTLLSNEEDFTPGFIIIILIDKLDELNERYGYLKANDLIKHVANACIQLGTQLSSIGIARINGAEFALIVKEHDIDAVNYSCSLFDQEVKKELGGYQEIKIYLGAAAYALHESPGSVLAKADQCLREVVQAPNGLCYKVNQSKPVDMKKIKEAIAHAIAEQRFALYSQKVTDEQSVFHQELFIKIKEEHSEQKNAGYFLPIAEQLGLAYQIDQFVLHALSKRSKGHREPFALNISEDTLVNQQHREAYVKLLSQLPEEQRALIHIELKESIIIEHFDEARMLFNHVNQLGIIAGIDQAGQHFSPMHYLTELAISYIKLDGSLIQDIHKNENEQFFIHYFNEMAKTLGIALIATRVEHKEQWETLQLLPLRWGQGHYLSPVEPIEPSN